MEQRLYEALQSNPIIAAVRDDEGLEACLQADVQTVFVLYGDICGIAGIVRRIKDAGKIAIVHADLITGLAAKEISVDFLHSTTLADGIISTRTNMIQRAKELQMIAILRVFLIDSMAFDAASARPFTITIRTFTAYWSGSWCARSARRCGMTRASARRTGACRR